MQQLALILSAAVLSLTLAACASSKPERREHANQFDSDGDGFLSREEYAMSALSEVIEFDSLDYDGDELLSPHELEFQMGREMGRGAKDRPNRGAKGSRRISGQGW